MPRKVFPAELQEYSKQLRARIVRLFHLYNPGRPSDHGAIAWFAREADYKYRQTVNRAVNGGGRLDRYGESVLERLEKNAPESK